MDYIISPPPARNRRMMMGRSQAAGEVALVTLIALSVVALAALAVAAAQILGGGKPVVAWTAGA